MTKEYIRGLSSEDIGRLDSAGEKMGGVDLLGELILARKVRREDLFNGLKPCTPLEEEREVK